LDAAEVHKLSDSLGGVMGLTILTYLVVEIAFLHFRLRKLGLREARACFLGVLSIGAGGALIAALALPISAAFGALAGARLSPIQGDLSAPWWLYGWVVYEFWYWVQHWAAHKVRLLWCMHSTHHAPNSMHMLVSANHHPLEALLYFPLFLGFVPALCGVPPVICVVINLIDALWGNSLHISDQVIAKGRYGWLGRFIQTPSYHRVHHAQNPLYMDTNYNSITLLWDWIFGTLQPLRDDEPVKFGITRPMDTGSFWDLQFGEFKALGRDLRRAKTWSERAGYLFRAPGWEPEGKGWTVSDAKRELAQNPIGAPEPL